MGSKNTWAQKLALTSALLFPAGCGGEKMPPEPGLGGVDILDANGTVIPLDKATNQDLRDFLTRLLTEAQNKGTEFLSDKDNIENGPRDIIDFDMEGGGYSLNLDFAKAEIAKGQYSRALGDVRDALKVKPTPIEDSQHLTDAADTRSLGERIGKEVTVPLKKVERALDYLVTYGRLQAPKDPGRGQ